MVHRFAPRARLEIGRAYVEGPPQRGAVSNKDNSTVISRVWPLMRVGGPGIRIFKSSGHRLVFWRNTRPQTDCTVNMHPSAVLLRRETNFFSRIKSARIYVSRLHADDRSLG